MFYVAVGAFAIGIGVATIFSTPIATIVWVMLLALAIAVVRMRTPDFAFRNVLYGLVLGLVFVSLGLLRTEWHKESFTNSGFDGQVGEEILFSGIVAKEPDERARVTQLTVSSGGERVLVSVDRHRDISYGDEVVVRGEMKRPEAFETDLGRTFNYPGYLLARGVTHTVSFAEVVVIGEDKANPIVARLLEVKHWLMRGIESVIEEPQAGLAEGLLLGVKQALGDDIEQAFRQSGIIHIVVLSGYNVMLVVAFFMLVLSPLPRRVRMLIGVLAVTGFALLVGLSATVVRASIMASIFLFADTFSRSYSVLRILFFAGAVMIFFNPYLLLFDIGFQLSFMATLGLVLITPQFETALSGAKIPGVREYVFATVATQIAVLPLLLYHIGEISIVAVVVNLLVLPVVPFAMLGAFLSGIFASLLPSLAVVFAYPTTLLLSYILFAAIWFASIPFATVTLPEFSPVWVLILYLAIGMALWFVSRETRSESTELDGWEIVEEADTLATKDATIVAASREEDETPIFFR